MDAPDLPHPVLIAAFILAVRTARLDEQKMQGMGTPQLMSNISASIWLADLLLNRARDRHPEWFAK
jgi:hypothetical protein